MTRTLSLAIAGMLAASCSPHVDDGQFSCARVGRCPDDAPFCRMDGTCHSTPDPDAGVAYPQCMMREECGPGGDCIRNEAMGTFGFCSPVCTTPATCPPATSGEASTCLNGRCRVGCDATTDCPMGVACLSGRFAGSATSVCLEERGAVSPRGYMTCSGDVDCPIPLSCLDGVCLRPCDMTTRLCLAGEVCAPTGDRSAFSCLVTCPDSECPPGARCDMTAGGMMVCIPESWPMMM